MSVYATKDGFILTVTKGDVDYGLRIEDSNGVTLYFSSVAFSSEEYGSKPAERYEDYDEADMAYLDGDKDAFIEWDDEDWEQVLEDEADELLNRLAGIDGGVIERTDNPIRTVISRL